MLGYSGIDKRKFELKLHSCLFHFFGKNICQQESYVKMQKKGFQMWAVSSGFQLFWNRKSESFQVFPLNLKAWKFTLQVCDSVHSLMCSLISHLKCEFLQLKRKFWY